MSDYDITKLINTVNKQTQVIDVLVRKVEMMTDALNEANEKINMLAAAVDHPVGTEF